MLQIFWPLITHNQFGARAQRRQVGTRIGLGKALRPSDLARERLRDKLRALRLGLTLEERRDDELPGDRNVPVGSPRAVEFLPDDLRPDDVRLLLGAAKAPRHATVQIAVFDGSLHERPLISRRRQLSVRRWPVGREEFAHFVAVGVEFRPEPQFHGDVALRCRENAGARRPDRRPKPHI